MSSSRLPSVRPEIDLSRHTEVSRPRRALLEGLEREGISWEGQAHIIGQGGVLPVWLIVTTDRLLLTNRDAILVEAPRSWLIPAPLHVQESGVRISITPEGVVPGHSTTERLLLNINEGRGPANQLVTILTGRSRRTPIQAEAPPWKEGVGAGRSSSLPHLPAFETTTDENSPRSQPDTNDPEVRGVAPLGSWRPIHSDAAPAHEISALRAPDPEPVAPSSRAGRFLANRDTTRRTSTPDVQAHENTPENVTPIERERRKRRAGWAVWSTRVAMFVVVALVAGWFARPYLPEQVDQRLPAIVSNDTAINPDPIPTSSASGEDGDGTNGAGSDPSDIMPTQAALGVGGATSPITTIEGDPDGTENPGEEAPTEAQNPSDPGAGVDSTTEGNDDSPAENDASDDQGNTDAGETGSEPDGSSDPAVEQPVATQPVAAEQPGDSLEPTASIDNPDDDPVLEPTVASETGAPAPTMAATESAETNAGESVPANDSTGGAVPTDVPKAAPTDVPAGPTLEPQPPSVNPETPPAQQFADQGFRYSVDGAATGSTLAELPEVADVGYGEWIVLSVTGENWTDEEQVFDMSRFTLIADGEELQLDVGNSWVGSLLDLTPSYGNTDAILWAPGEEHQFVLTFLAPNDANSLLLQAGNQQFNLSELLSNVQGLRETAPPADIDTVEANIVRVINGETIVIEKDGVEQTVRYLGIDIPSDQDCYANASTEANRRLVEGRTIRIERQATNVDAKGNWVRDVWVQQDDGRYVLVAHQLVQEGAAEADISEPNTRFASWLRSAEAVAQAEGRGLWGACSSADAAAPIIVTLPVADTDRRVTS